MSEEIMYIPENRRGLYHAALRIVRETNSYKVLAVGYRCQQDKDFLEGSADTEHLVELLGGFGERLPVYIRKVKIQAVEENEIEFSLYGQKLSLGDLINFLNNTSFRRLK